MFVIIIRFVSAMYGYDLHSFIVFVIFRSPRLRSPACSHPVLPSTCYRVTYCTENSFYVLFYLSSDRSFNSAILAPKPFLFPTASSLMVPPFLDPYGLFLPMELCLSILLPVQGLVCYPLWFRSVEVSVKNHSSFLDHGRDLLKLFV